MKLLNNSKLLITLTMLVGLLTAGQASAQTAGFTYQGRLTDNGSPANGNYDLQFTLFPTESGGSEIGSSLNIAPVAVTNGLFTQALDFGVGVFDGSPRWLEIAVRTNGSGSPRVVLSPRQALLSSPYAIYTQNAGTANTALSAVANSVNGAAIQNKAITAAKIASGQVVQSLNGLKDNVTVSAGPNITLMSTGNNISISASSAAVGNAWSLNGNVGTSPTNDFLGTTDDEPLVIKTSGREALRVDSLGDIGIGTTNPLAKLHVIGSAIQLTSKVPPIGTGIIDFGSISLITTIANLSVGETPKAILAGSPYLLINPDEGNTVGIGSSSSSAKLHVVSGGGFTAPQMEIQQTRPYDYARLRFLSSVADVDFPYTVHPLPPWDIAVGDGQMNFFVEGGSGDGNIMSLKPDGSATINGDAVINGTGKVKVLMITGGADVAEPFKMSSYDIRPGAVVIIDEEHPGQLKLSERAYDTRVAGIVSGANGVQPGISLLQRGVLEGEKNVALSGRVYALADASVSPIKPGDQLTTSSTPGHCMKATDHAKAHGAIIGKAITELKTGKGTVLVLVSLQ